LKKNGAIIEVNLAGPAIESASFTIWWQQFYQNLLGQKEVFSSAKALKVIHFSSHETILS